MKKPSLASVRSFRALRSAIDVLTSPQFQSTLQAVRESDLLGGDVFAAEEIRQAQRAIETVRRIALTIESRMGRTIHKPGKEG